jgi:VWFA-related protein
MISLASSRSSAFAWLLAAIAFCMSGSAALAQGPLDLIGGVWVQNEDESDDLMEVLAEARQGAPSAPAPPAGVTLGALARRSDRDSPEEREQKRLARGLLVLRIEVSGAELSIRNGNREARRVFTDGRQADDGLFGRARAGVQGEALVVETEGETWMRRETFQLSSSGRRLEVTTEVDRGDAPSYRLFTVYDLVERIAPRPLAGGSEAASPGAPGSEGAADGAAPAPTASAPLGRPAPVGTPRVATGVSPRDAGAAAVSPDGWRRRSKPSVVRLLPPPPAPGLLRGKVLFQTLTIDPEVQRMDFYLDGERVGRRTVPPFETRIMLADPAREQTVRVAAIGPGGEVLGEDRLVVNRLDPPFRVRIAAIERESGSLRVRAEVSVPRKAQLSEVLFFKSDQRLEATAGDPLAVTLAEAEVGPADYVRVVGRLRDGRELEAVSLLQEGVFSEELDVHLVQLQVLVTDRRGVPVTGLEAADFEVVDGGQKRQIERLYPARDVALVMGLAIDSSGSMAPLWRQTLEASTEFLDSTLAERDRAFVVDFDSSLRLLQPVTGDKAALRGSLSRLRPDGGTALYDSILFSLLQFEDEPGRRALVVLTDGVDSESRADPRRAIEFGKRLGVPVYVIGMSGGAGQGGPGAGLALASARGELTLITDPTGGRLFHVASPEQVSRVFEQIRDELHSQYVLTYYTDRAPGVGARPTVKVLRKGTRVKTALPLDLAD